MFQGSLKSNFWGEATNTAMGSLAPSKRHIEDNYLNFQSYLKLLKLSWLKPHQNAHLNAILSYQQVSATVYSYQQPSTKQLWTWTAIFRYERLLAAINTSHRLFLMLLTLTNNHHQLQPFDFHLSHCQPLPAINSYSLLFSTIDKYKSY